MAVQSVFKNFQPILIFIFIFENSFFNLAANGNSIECNNKTHNEVEVSILKITLNESSPPIGTNKLNKTTFEKEESIRFRLDCSSLSQPVKWITNEDFVGYGITGVSHTKRKVKNFTDEPTYEYSAVYILEIKQKEIPVVFICQQITEYPNCGRAVVLASDNPQLDKYSVELLPRDSNKSEVAEFDNRLSWKTKTETVTCPFKLLLHYNEDNGQLTYGWRPQGGSSLDYTILSAQSLENSYRFDKLLDESCIEYRSNGAQLYMECPPPDCTTYEYGAHKFKLIALVYSLGAHRTILKGYFELQGRRNFKYIWQYANPEAQMLLYLNDDEKELYKGQKINVECHSSLFLFSYGTVIAWSVEGDMSPRGFASEIDEPVGEITVLTKGIVRPEKQFLDENNISLINISCIAPIWNSTRWITLSQGFSLKDSETPVIIQNNDSVLDSSSRPYYIVEVGSNFTLKCVSQGIPPPELNITFPQENLNVTTTVNKFGNLSVLLVNFHKFEANYAGKYNCVATSSVGQDYQIFELETHTGIPYFVKIILTCTAVASAVFLIVVIALYYKFKKEKQDFIRLTQEAVKKFHEGFKNTTSIDFDAKSEYKSYEVPISKWVTGGTLLGSGTFGVVQRGSVVTGKNIKSTVAIKTVSSPKDVTDFENSLMELTIMSYIGKHENVVSLVAACTENIDRRSLLIGVEYCSNGDLLNYLQKKRPLFYSFTKDGSMALDWIDGKSPYANVVNSANFSTFDLYTWSYQIANGMQYLESKKVLHADLAARNVLLTQDKIAKISDFGLSRTLMESNNYTKKTNSPLPWRWMALESLKFQNFSSKTDIWSYGVVLYEIFSLAQEPWPGLSWTIDFVTELEEGRRLARPHHATEYMYSKVMLECWRNEPQDRITFAEARDFFKNAMTRLNSTDGQDEDYLSIC